MAWGQGGAHSPSQPGCPRSPLPAPVMTLRSQYLGLAGGWGARHGATSSTRRAGESWLHPLPLPFCHCLHYLQHICSFDHFLPHHQHPAITGGQVGTVSEDPNKDVLNSRGVSGTEQTQTKRAGGAGGGQGGPEGQARAHRGRDPAWEPGMLLTPARAPCQRGQPRPWGVSECPPSAPLPHPTAQEWTQTSLS